ncbi:MAG: LysR family transcriptional regulator [Acidimicrobiaceae bacterium]|nr:LysR family transcriptional regulator [Acidimicrobiaceae bacterium]
MIYTTETARRIDANYLVTLAVVAETRSISEAATQLGLSQPAVSQQLKQLSEAMGERLHVRHGHGIQLTAAGKSLADRSQAVLRGYRSVLDYVGGLSQGEGGTLSLAASNTVAGFLMPDLIVRYRNDNPGVRLELRSGNSEQVVEEVMGWHVELGIMESPGLVVTQELREFEIEGDELILVGSPHLIDQIGSSIQASRLNEVHLVWREKGSGVRNVAEEALHKGGVDYRIDFEIAGGEGVKEAIMRSLGAGFISSRAVVRDLGEGRLGRIEVVGLNPIRRNYRVLFHDGTLSVPARRFLDYLNPTRLKAAEVIEVPPVA